MEKKYQVFISSTYEDLKEERKNVIETLLMMNCIPAGMEAFCAADEEQFEYIKKVIDLCDYYVLIIGKRYGSISELTGKSYTEMEFDYAKSKGIPILVFPVYADADKPSDGYEKELTAFKKKAYGRKMGAYWRTPDGLGRAVAISLEEAIKRNDRPGWIRLGEGESFQDVQVQSVAEAEELPFGEENLAVPFRDQMLGLWTSDSSVRTTWEELYTYISPMLSEEVTSAQVANRIIAFATGGNSTEYNLKNSFEMIFLNRLIEAGYVCKRTVRNKVYYSLTPKGQALTNKKSFANCSA